MAAKEGGRRGGSHEGDSQVCVCGGENFLDIPQFIQHWVRWTPHSLGKGFATTSRS